MTAQEFWDKFDKEKCGEWTCADCVYRNQNYTDGDSWCKHRKEPPSSMTCNKFWNPTKLYGL